ncbi:unnamed protein product [Phytophthora lilii]|uniref:Unnamed protein product n=1 Tax=Phytophthora lilii TaxID=2077276 RepID=A0A9W6WR58_9STRA|nr:unnamed protein product [Phytophthora lilii]
MDYGRRFYKFCTSFQFELRGYYSAERIDSLNKYCHTVPTLRALLIAVMSPLPCLIIVAVLIRGMTPQLNASAVDSSSHECCYHCVQDHDGKCHWFSAAFFSPSRFTSVDGDIFCMLYILFWEKRFKQEIQLRHQLVNFVKMVSYPATLTLVYPVYLYRSAHASAFAQTFYIAPPSFLNYGKKLDESLLGQKYDITSRMVIFNVEILSALSVSGSMQNSKSFVTTVFFISLDIALVWISLKDQGHLMRYPTLLRHKLPIDHPMKFHR